MTEKKLSDEILQEYQNCIEEEIAITLKVLRGINDYHRNHSSSESHSSYSIHKAESGADTAYQEKQGKLLDKETLKLKRLQSALKRVYHKTYGICTVCGCYIPESRLKIVVYAKRCVICEGKEEGKRRII